MDRFINYIAGHLRGSGLPDSRFRSPSYYKLAIGSFADTAKIHDKTLYFAIAFFRRK